MKIYKVTCWVDDGCKKYESTENVVAPNAEIAASTYKKFLEAGYDTVATIVNVSCFDLREGDVSILGRKKTLETLEKQKNSFINTEIVITVEGGFVSDVYCSDKNAIVSVLDFDSTDEEHIEQISEDLKSVREKLHNVH